MKKLLTLTCIIPGLLLLSCDKEKVAQPMPSSSSYFTCEVNSEPWTAETPPNSNGPMPLNGEFSLPNGNLTLMACRNSEDGSIFQRIDFIVKNITSIGQYPMYTGGSIYGFIDFNDNSQCSIYKHDSLNPGTVVITDIDTVNRLIKGEFQATLVNEECISGSQMLIEDGQFNFRY